MTPVGGVKTSRSPRGRTLVARGSHGRAEQRTGRMGRLGACGTVGRLLCVLLLCAARAAAATVSPRPFSIVGYVPEWRYENLDWDTLCAHTTHLILFSLEVTASGRVSALDRLPPRAELEAARVASQKHGTKLLLCFGGNGRSDGFAAMVSSKETRRSFLTDVAKLLELNGLHGVDYNWEYPHGKQQWEGLATLILETRRKFKATKLITMAYYPDGAQEHAIAAHGIHRTVDLLLMMAYDQPGRHSTHQFAQQATARSATTLPPEKLALGLPFYARHTVTGEWKTYDELLRAHGEAMAPRTDEVDQWFFNNVNTIERKTKDAIAARLGGVMVWEVGQDCASYKDGPCNPHNTAHEVAPARFESRSLLAAVGRAVRKQRSLLQAQAAGAEVKEEL